MLASTTKIKMMTEKGRTIWDFISENKVLSTIVLILFVLIVMFIIMSNNVEFQGLKITPKEALKSMKVNEKKDSIAICNLLERDKFELQTKKDGSVN